MRSGAILASNERTPAIQAGLRGPPDILGHVEPGRLLGLSQPVALLLVAVLHFFPGVGAPAERVGELHAALAPGSHVVISHETEDGRLAQVTGTHELDAQSHPRRPWERPFSIPSGSPGTPRPDASKPDKTTVTTLTRRTPVCEPHA